MVEESLLNGLETEVYYVILIEIFDNFKSRLINIYVVNDR